MTASPFVTGYIKAALADLNKRYVHAMGGGCAPLTADDLSPSALEAVLRDCEALQKDGSVFFNTRDPKESAAGARCWRDRQNSALPSFPPLSPHLSDDGQVHGLGEVAS